MGLVHIIDKYFEEQVRQSHVALHCAGLCQHDRGAHLDAVAAVKLQELPREEQETLLLATAQEHTLAYPLRSFLHLQPELQAFVLRQRGFERFIGRRVG